MAVRLEDYEVWLTSLLAVSVLTFIGSLVAVPILVARIPADYFAHPRRPGRPLGHWWSGRFGVVGRVLKNLVGGILMVAGVVMLVLPGQGLVTMFIGLLLVDVPGKYRIEKWIVSRDPICRAINWLRRRAKREPLIIDGQDPGCHEVDP